MADAGRIYRRTAAGDKAVGSDDRSVPLDYRRILQLVSSDTHEDVIRGCLRQYPDKLLADWLTEIEELGLLKSAPAPEEADLDFTIHAAVHPAASSTVLAADAPRLERDSAAARRELSKAGAYFAPARLANRPPVSKPPARTAVLIVEDDPDQLALAKLRVSLAGYPVRGAQSAKELVEALHAKGAPDILLLDVMLPDGNGFDILAKMRRHAQLALLPVVMLTAKDDPADIKKGLVLGADGYVTKPYSRNILVDAIRKVLKQTVQR